MANKIAKRTTDLDPVPVAPQNPNPHWEQEETAAFMARVVDYQIIVGRIAELCAGYIPYIGTVHAAKLWEGLVGEEATKLRQHIGFMTGVLKALPSAKKDG